MMEEIRITLETLYDILMNEKKKGDLQKLNDSFFIDTVSYLKEKRSLLENKKNEDDLFAVGEKEKLESELRSIRRILKEIYEKREKKIIDITLNKSRTQSDVIDTGAMLKEEKDFFNQLLTLLDGYRKGILANLFKGEIPFFQKPAVQVPEILKEEPEKAETAVEKEDDDKEIDLKKVKFIKSTGSFVWKDLKEYGPFQEGDELEIFAEVADLIVEKGHAVIV